MDDTSYARLLTLAQHSRLARDDARGLEIEAERRQDLRGYFTGLLRQDRAADLKRVAYEMSATRARDVAEALSRLPPEPPVWTALLTAASVWSHAEHEVVARNIERWPTAVRVAAASWCSDVVRGQLPVYWPWVRAAKLLREDEAHLPEALRAEGLRQIELLDLSHNDLGSEGVAEVAASHGLGGLQELLLTGVGCQDVGAIALADSAHLPVLHTLTLSHNDIEAEGAARLVAINRLTALQALDLSVNPIDGVELAHALAELAPRPGGLRSLLLEDNGFGPQALADLVWLRHVGDVEHLSLSGNDIGATGVAALADSRLAHLRSLSLAHGGLGVPGICALVEAPWLPRLRTLDLRDNAAGDDGLATLLHSGKLGGLEVLRFDANELTDLTGRLLRHHTHLIGLRALHLSGNGLTGSGCAELVSNPALGWLETLDLSATCLDGSGDVLAESLQRAEHMRSLTELRLPALTDRGANALASAEHLASLRVLSIDPGIGESGARVLREAPHFNTCEIRI